jgi:pantoate--beta-alanine ligase
MQVVSRGSEVLARVRDWQREGLVVGMVPTMGALHAGHLALVEAARERCERVAATLYVNPLQFGPGEDFERYPRDFDGDLEKLRAGGCDLLFAPSDEEMYPGLGADAHRMRTRITVHSLSEGLCGRHRPGHFDGVATEVMKLFHLVPADVAFFGDKDYQQRRVIEQMASDLSLPIEIAGVPTVREPDGLALSSRNAYLSPDERRAAPALHAELASAAEAVRAPGADVAALLRSAVERLSGRGFAVEYFELVDAESLAPLSAPPIGAARVAAAARLGATRLIDNVPVAPASPPPGARLTGAAA